MMTTTPVGVPAEQALPACSLWDRIGPLVVRFAQTLLDPFSILMPGVPAMLQAGGLCRDSSRYVNPTRLARGLVLILPGVEGPGLYAACVRRGLADLPAAVRVFNWAGWWPALWTLFSRPLRRRGLDAILAMVRDYRRDYPGRPVVLVGHSAGAAMTVFAAEALGATEPLTGAIVTATPLHPEYDLSAAIAGVDHELVSCHSRLDVQLRAVISIGGNFDGRRGRTVGQDGFGASHAKLRQIAWDRSMIPAGHLGGHAGWASRAWVTRHIAPILREWIDRS